MAWRSVQQHNHSSSCSGSPEERSTEQDFATNACRIVSMVLNSCYKKEAWNSVLYSINICLALLTGICLQSISFLSSPLCWLHSLPIFPLLDKVYAEHESKEFSIRLDMLLLFPKQIANIQIGGLFCEVCISELPTGKSNGEVFSPTVSQVVCLGLLCGWKYVTGKCQNWSGSRLLCTRVKLFGFLSLISISSFHTTSLKKVKRLPIAVLQSVPRL